MLSVPGTLFRQSRRCQSAVCFYLAPPTAIPIAKHVSFSPIFLSTTHRNSLPISANEMPDTVQSKKPVLHEYDSHGDYDPNLCNFQIGAPHPTELIKCSQIMENALHSISKQEPYWRSSCFQYGTVAGSDPARDALSAFLSEQHGFTIPPDNLMVTCGASLSLTLVCDEFFGRNQHKDQPIAFVEHPTYFLALDVLEGMGFKILPIPKNTDGTIDYEEWGKLASALPQVSTKENGLSFRALVYLIPTFHNPTGTSLSDETVKKVFELCEEQNLLIHCDDVYNLLYYTPEVPRRILPVGKSHRVISSGSFSKLLGPGLRTGWIESTPDVIDRISNTGVIVSGGCLNQFGSYLIERAYRSGELSKHVQELRDLYKTKVQAFERVFSANLPSTVSWNIPEGGYFIWLRLPDGHADHISNDLVPKAKAAGVKFQLGSKSCSAARAGLPCALGCANCLRLSIGHVTVAQIEEGAAVLCNLIREMLQGL